MHLSPWVVKGAASAMQSNGRTLIAARAIRGNSPPEEGGATLATAEGPTGYRLVGVAPTGGRRPFDSLHSLRPFDSSA